MFWNFCKKKWAEEPFYKYIVEWSHSAVHSAQNPLQEQLVFRITCTVTQHNLVTFTNLSFLICMISPYRSLSMAWTFCMVPHASGLNREYCSTVELWVLQSYALKAPAFCTPVSTRMAMSKNVFQHSTKSPFLWRWVPLAQFQHSLPLSLVTPLSTPCQHQFPWALPISTDCISLKLSSSTRLLSTSLGLSAQPFASHEPQFYAVMRIRDVYPGSDFFPSRIPDPNCFHPGSRILVKKKTKKWFLSSKKYDPGCSSRIRMLTFYPSRIPDPGVKKAPDPWSRIPIRYTGTSVLCPQEPLFYVHRNLCSTVCPQEPLFYVHRNLCSMSTGTSVLCPQEPRFYVHRNLCSMSTGTSVL